MFMLMIQLSCSVNDLPVARQIQWLVVAVFNQIFSEFGRLLSEAREIVPMVDRA